MLIFSFSQSLPPPAVSFRLKSKRIYKTLLRSHHKHNSTESQQESSSNHNSDEQHEHLVHLQRSNSTPSLKRCWLCQSCKVLNNSVTWHCLNCECVSVVAPIYKEQKGDTIQKGCIRNEPTTVASVAAAATVAAAVNAIAKDTHLINNIRCKSKPIPNSISCDKFAKGAMNQSSLNGFDRPTNRFSHRQMDACPALMAANATTTGDCYVNQVKYNEMTRYRPVGGLCPLNRHLENKSLPNITDAFNESNMPTKEMSEHLFGERIFTVNKPNAFTTTAKTTTASTNHGINSARKALTPVHEIHKFTRYATKSAARESVVKKMCTPGEACRMCNLGRCQNDAFSMNKISNDLDTSRFTITTLSRNAVKTNDNNQTLSRNGGVLIAVRDWSMEKSSTPKNNGISTETPMSPDSYYEILRNPNNNTATEQMSNKDGNRMAKSQTSHIYENSISPVKTETNGPIYAVVNKLNKTKNTKMPSTTQSIRSPEQTKFTYIGMNPHNVKSKPAATVDPDALYASNKNLQHNNNLSNNNNNGVAALQNNVMPSLNSVNNNNNSVTSNDSTTNPPPTNAEFSTKVWKGNKKPMESNKK